MTSRRRSRTVVVALVVVVVTLAGLRLAAPGFLERLVNDKLSNLDAYRGEIDDLDLAVWRGAGIIKGLTISKVDSTLDQPLVVAPSIDVSVQWSALLAGELVAEADLVSPEIHFVHTEREAQYGEETDWRQKLGELLPIRVNRLSVSDGRVHFHNPDTSPPVEIEVADIELTIANLTNIREQDKPVYTGLEATALVAGGAPLKLTARLDPLQEEPQFDFDLELSDLELTRLNPLLDAYLNVTAEGGTFSLSSEVAATQGAYKGYVKPLLDHVEILRAEDFKQRPLAAIWESTVAAVVTVFENPAKDRLGTRVPVEGKFEPEPDVLAAIVGVFRNLFDAFLQGIEGSVDLQEAFEEVGVEGPSDSD